MTSLKIFNKRQQENIRDNFIADVKKAIQENGNLCDKQSTQSIRPIRNQKINLIEFGDMYDNNADSRVDGYATYR